MRFAVMNGKAGIVQGSSFFDVARLSDGRFGPDPADIFEAWTEFREWAGTQSLTDQDADGEFDERRAEAPVPAPRQVFGIGLNYRAHQLETGLPEPDFPLVFTKFPSSIGAAHSTVELPTDQVDWEVEAAVVIGTKAYRVHHEDAWQHVAGITASQDISARDVQLRPKGTPQFSMGKSFPGFTPIGPVLVTPDELEDPNDIALSCVLNGETVQASSTSDLIFSVGKLIEYLSGILPLLPGDIILTGTPSGVGLGENPPRFLKPGDELVTRVGEMQLETHFVASTWNGAAV